MVLFEIDDSSVICKSSEYIHVHIHVGIKYMYVRYYYLYTGGEVVALE